jgi:hypothetical protein
VRALEREVREGSDWSPGFFERLAESNSELAASVDELMQAVKAARRSKAPRRL